MAVSTRLKAERIQDSFIQYYDRINHLHKQILIDHKELSYCEGISDYKRVLSGNCLEKAADTIETGARKIFFISKKHSSVSRLLCSILSRPLLLPENLQRLC